MREQVETGSGLGNRMLGGDVLPNTEDEEAGGFKNEDCTMFNLWSWALLGFKPQLGPSKALT